MENFNTFTKHDGTHDNLVRSDNYLTEEQSKWVIEIAPVIVCNNNIMAGTPRCKEYRDNNICIRLNASIPTIDYQINGRWVRAFNMDENNNMGSWYEYLGRLAVQLEKEKEIVFM